VIPEVPAGEESDAFAVADWIESYEAEQHRLCVGPSTEPVCWTLCGFASGYMTAVHQRPVYAVEERCPLEGTLSTVMAELERADRDLAAKKRALDEAQRTPFANGSIIVASPAMRRVLELVERVARTDTTVLVTGESGVGKER
jgi:transcriptional regulator with GAF, ATPase, and Fis domain